MPISSPSTDLYTLGRGILTIGAWSGTTPPTVNADVGNTKDFKFKLTETELDHFCYRSGFKKKDKIVTLESGYEGNFILDEISRANLLKFLRGTLSGTTIRANTVLNAEYELEFTQDNPVGENYKYTFHRVRIKPNGDFSLIADDWTTLDFAFTGLSDSTHNPSSEWFDVEYLTTTTAP
jgi:hypothetical protein